MPTRARRPACAIARAGLCLVQEGKLVGDGMADEIQFELRKGRAIGLLCRAAGYVGSMPEGQLHGKWI